MQPQEAKWRRHFEWRARAFANDADIVAYSAHGIATRMRVFGSLLGQFSLPAKADILDLGCGIGLYVRRLAADGYRAVGTDFSLPSLQRAVAGDRFGGRYVAGEAYALPYRDASFDLVLSLGVFAVVSDPPRMLCEIARVLRPGAGLVLESLNGRSVVGRAWRLRAAVTGKPHYMGSYDRARVNGWLEEAGLTPQGTRGIYVAPSRHLQPVLGRPGLQAAFDGHPRLGELAAHALLFVARKLKEGR
jgi:SAM-dependent methyltransferase